MKWKLYILWLIFFFAGVIFVYVLPADSLSPSLRYLFLGIWGAVVTALFNTITYKLSIELDELIAKFYRDSKKTCDNAKV